jgi:hypothetical protein
MAVLPMFPVCSHFDMTTGNKITHSFCSVCPVFLLFLVLCIFIRDYAHRGNRKHWVTSGTLGTNRTSNVFSSAYGVSGSLATGENSGNEQEHPPSKRSGYADGKKVATLKQQACVQTLRVFAPCSRCGAWPDVVHVFGDQPAMYCAQCCPTCSPAPSSQEAA